MSPFFLFHTFFFFFSKPNSKATYYAEKVLNSMFYFIRLLSMMHQHVGKRHFIANSLTETFILLMLWQILRFESRFKSESSFCISFSLKDISKKWSRLWWWLDFFFPSFLSGDFKGWDISVAPQWLIYKLCSWPCFNYVLILTKLQYFPLSCGGIRIKSGITWILVM